MKEIKTCPVCGGNDLTVSIELKDHSITSEQFKILNCKECSHFFTSPLPEENNIGKYYQSTDYISHSDSRTGLVNSLYHFARNFTLKQKIKLVESYNQPGQLLDIGCGTGYFLQEAKKNNWEVKGTEPDNNARKLAEDISSSEISTSVFDLKEGLKFDVITMWHVLEHVYDLSKTMSKIESLLKPNGTLIIALPNPESWDAGYYKSYWAAYDVPRHIHHFTKNSLGVLLQKQSLDIVKTKPMLLDSYYISLLSEKYKGKQNLIKSILIGSISNIKALTGNKNYSSIIYIVKRK